MATNRVRNSRRRLKLTGGSFWKKPMFVKKANNTYVVPLYAEGRPDTISEEIYGTSDFKWVVMMYNDITDPFSELSAGTLLNYPDVEEMGNFIARGV